MASGNFSYVSFRIKYEILHLRSSVIHIYFHFFMSKIWQVLCNFKLNIMSQNSIITTTINAADDLNLARRTGFKEKWANFGIFWREVNMK